MSEEQLKYHIVNVQNGDLNSFRYIVDSHKNIAMAIAFKIIKDKHRAEDAVQDSFVAIYKNIGKFNFSVKFSTWLYKIVMNNALMTIRSNSAKYFREIISINDVEIPDDIHERFEDIDLSNAIQTCMEKIPDQYSIILKLYYYEDLDLAEITEVLGLGYGNAKTLLHRARLRQLSIFSVL